MRIRALLLRFVLPVLLLGTPLAAQQPPNVLLLVADDLGVDRVGAYEAHPDPGHTPVIDSLAAQGVLFRNAYSNPSCSPTRATYLTGRYGQRTGVGRGLPYLIGTLELALGETCLAEVLAPAYRTAALGKWHLTNQFESGLLHPQLQGFEHFRGSMDIFPGALSNGFFDWTKVEDGVQFQSTTYATTETVDDALELIASFGGQPWFVLVGFHAPHAPFHKPPASLHTFSLPASVSQNIPVHMQAATEAMDTEIGRLLASMDPVVRANTVVVFVADNGTDKPAVTPPSDPLKAKGTLYEGGVHVPLIVSGPGVASGAECQALVNTTDLFATIAELAGQPQTTGIDSVSLVPYFTQPGLPSLRAWAYAETFNPNSQGAWASRSRAVRDGRYKLIAHYVNSTLPSQLLFFDLWTDPTESNDLLVSQSLSAEQQASYDALVAVLDEEVPLWQTIGHGTPGTQGVPTLGGSGTLQPLTPFGLELASARPNALAYLVIGITNISLLFSGGVFVPSPDILLLVGTDSLGTFRAGTSWPPGIPTGSPILFQFWIEDPAGSFGYASSNGVAATQP